MKKKIRGTALLLLLLLFNWQCRNANSIAKEGFKNLEQGKKITALRFFEEALDVNKNNPLALYGKGKILIESNLTFNLGQKLIETALPKLDSEYKTDAVMTLAKSYARTNLYDKAIKYLEESIKNGVHVPDMFIDLSFYYMQTLEKTKGRNILLKGLETYPKSISIYIALAQTDLKYYNNYTSAIQTLEKALAVDSTNQEVCKKIAILYYRIRKADKTMEYLKRLRDLQTDESQKAKVDAIILEAKSGKWQPSL